MRAPGDQVGLAHSWPCDAWPGLLRGLPWTTRKGGLWAPRCPVAVARAFGALSWARGDARGLQPLAEEHDRWRCRLQQWARTPLLAALVEGAATTPHVPSTCCERLALMLSRTEARPPLAGLWRRFRVDSLELSQHWLVARPGGSPRLSRCRGSRPCCSCSAPCLCFRLRRLQLGSFWSILAHLGGSSCFLQCSFSCGPSMLVADR